MLLRSTGKFVAATRYRPRALGAAVSLCFRFTRRPLT